MLQQTQVARVIERWRAFLTAFPDPAACAAAPRSAVLRAWAGLGYNGRAVRLHQAARAMCEHHGGAVPADLAALRALPGVGPYTARAVLAFAFGCPVGVVDTNAARVLARFVANRPLSPSDAQRLADGLVDPTHPGAFNQTVLDLGATFCTSRPRCASCPARRSCAWRRSDAPDPAARATSPPPPFIGSTRQRRGQLIERLRQGSVSESHARRVLGGDAQSQSRLHRLERDGLVERHGGRVHLADA